jgi:hypothetical protein
LLSRLWVDWRSALAIEKSDAVISWLWCAKIKPSSLSTGAGSGLQGTCASETIENGDISAYPDFVGPKKNNFQLKANSPTINAGDNNAPDIPKEDLAHNPRIVGGSLTWGHTNIKARAEQGFSH